MSHKTAFHVEIWIQCFILSIALAATLMFSPIARASEPSKDMEQDTHLAYQDGQIRQLQADLRETTRAAQDNRFTIAKDEGYALGGFAAISLFQGIGIVVAAFLKRG